MTDKNSAAIDPAAPFSSFGGTEIVALSKLQKLTGQYLVKNWAAIPHVTHSDEADVTDLELMRLQHKPVTALAYLVKAVTLALQQFPRLNASLDVAQQNLILKHYFHIGIAVSTPKGLLVPVLRDTDKMPVEQIAQSISALSSRARSTGLSVQEMSGGCFTISSLGRHGGTGFTPIINAPEVAILGVSRIQERAKRSGEALLWRQVLPLSMSYDHRVVNGADAGAFMSFLVATLEQPEQLHSL